MKKLVNLFIGLLLPVVVMQASEEKPTYKISASIVEISHITGEKTTIYQEITFTWGKQTLNMPLPNVNSNDHMLMADHVFYYTQDNKLHTIDLNCMQPKKAGSFDETIQKELYKENDFTPLNEAVKFWSGDGIHTCVALIPYLHDNKEIGVVVISRAKTDGSLYATVFKSGDTNNQKQPCKLEFNDFSPNDSILQTAYQAVACDNDQFFVWENKTSTSLFCTIENDQSTIIPQQSFKDIEVKHKTATEKKDECLTLHKKKKSKNEFKKTYFKKITLSPLILMEKIKIGTVSKFTTNTDKNEMSISIPFLSDGITCTKRSLEDVSQDQHSGNSFYYIKDKSLSRIRGGLTRKTVARLNGEYNAQVSASDDLIEIPIPDAPMSLTPYSDEQGTERGVVLLTKSENNSSYSITSFSNDLTFVQQKNHVPTSLPEIPFEQCKCCRCTNFYFVMWGTNKNTKEVEGFLFKINHDNGSVTLEKKIDLPDNTTDIEEDNGKLYCSIQGKVTTINDAVILFTPKKSDVPRNQFSLEDMFKKINSTIPKNENLKTPFDFDWLFQPSTYVFPLVTIGCCALLYYTYTRYGRTRPPIAPLLPAIPALLNQTAHPENITLPFNQSIQNLTVHSPLQHLFPQKPL